MKHSEQIEVYPQADLDLIHTHCPTLPQTKQALRRLNAIFPFLCSSCSDRFLFFSFFFCFFFFL